MIILLTIGMVLFLSFLPMISVQAAEEYGVVYDETGLLWSEELEHLGTEVLPELTSKYDIDLRVDVITTLSEFEDLPQATEYIYQQYGYGGVHGGNGVTLTLLVHEDETGVALDAWHPYAAGESWELVQNATWNMDVGELLTEEAWAGDCEEDAKVLAQAVSNMAEGIEHFVLAGGVHSTIWHPENGFVWEQTEEADVEQEEPVMEKVRETPPAEILTETLPETVEGTQKEDEANSLELIEDPFPEETGHTSRFIYVVLVLLIGLVVVGTLIFVVRLRKK